MKDAKFLVTKDQEGKRLDLYLAIIQNEMGRGLVRTAINEGKVLLNGEVEFRPHYKVKEGDEIAMPTLIKVEQSEWLKPENIPLDIVYEDQDLLVINKPAGMVTHPATGNFSGTMMNGVAYYCSTIVDVGDKIRSGLINRIDKETSGLVLVGKTNEGLWHYSKQFAERNVNKIYIAICAGNISTRFTNGRLIVRNYLGRNPKARKKFSIVAPAKGRFSETEFKLERVLKIEGKDYSVILASPHTGRTHQIRVHLSSLGFPILGDTIYGPSQKYERLMLHSWKVELKLVNGEDRVFRSEIPEEFKPFMIEK